MVLVLFLHRCPLTDKSQPRRPELADVHVGIAAGQSILLSGIFHASCQNNRPALYP